MIRLFSRWLLGALVAGQAALAQDTKRLAPVAHFFDQNYLTPGGIALLDFTGVPGENLNFQHPPDQPWPLEVKGLSVILRSAPTIRTRGTEQRLPIGGISWSPDCGRMPDGSFAEPLPGCTRTRILVRLPLDLVPNLDTEAAAWRNEIRLEGVDWRSAEFFKLVSVSVIRFLNHFCTPMAYFMETARCGVPFIPYITDEDGKYPEVVKPGQKLSIYAYGLGPLHSGTPDSGGDPAPEEAPTMLRYRLAIEFRPTIPLRPTLSYRMRDLIPIVSNLPNWRIVEPTYAGVAPGKIGVYRVDFQVPEPPPGVPSCTRDSLPGVFDSGNTSITLFADFNQTALTDSTRMCVDTSSPAR